VPRRLGQHFLRPGAVERLVRAIGPDARDTFLEIGPGQGALTLPLAARARALVAVELDGALAARLAQRAPANVTIVTGDALAVDLRSLVPAGSRVVGNLPYYISSPLLRRFLDLRGHVSDLHVMVQEEVARRVISPPGSREYGIPSVLFALWTDAEIALRFAPGSFSPPPKVDSAVLRVRFLQSPRAEVGNLAGFEGVLKKAFAHRRRTLENNLRDSYPNLKENLRLLKIAGSRRAETLSVVEFAGLAAALETARGDV
jgi:16S rRNA (adenine1518-N6/adenine1519-N6)-dimethyltransferase